MSILVLGELHIPYRSPGISHIVKKKLKEEKISCMFCTGNLCTWGVLNEVNELVEETYVVRGSEDEQLQPENLDTYKSSSMVVNYDRYAIGLVSDICTLPECDPLMLSIVAESLNVDILIFGGCPTFQAFRYQNRLFLSPGSLTNAFESPLLNYGEEPQTISTPYKCVTLVDKVDPSDLSKESILSYKFPNLRELQAQSYLLLDIGTNDDYGKINVQLNTLSNNNLRTEVINCTALTTSQPT